jgi:dihydroorotase
VKSYPRGVTTNSESGIESYTTYYEVFKAMEEEGMVLNLHGEVPSDPRTVGEIFKVPFSSNPEPISPQNTCVLNAERHFLKHLVRLHADFPKLRIVLEHATTKEAIAIVRNLGPTVACTITAHHLDLIVDDWARQGFHFCKPVAKYPEDRQALRDVVREGNAGIGLIECLYRIYFDINAGS